MKIYQSTHWLRRTLPSCTNAIRRTSRPISLTSVRPFLAFAALVLAPPAVAAAEKYATFDSRMLAAAGPQVFWIDNNEVLFLAAQSTVDAAAANKERWTYSVRRWDIRGASVSTVREFGEDHPRICYYDGLSLYQFRRKDNVLQAYHGRLGLEEAVDPKQYGFLFCRRLTEIPKIPDWMNGREAKRLEHINGGFIDFGPSQGGEENAPVRFYRYGEKREGGVQLPFGRQEIKPRFRYYEFRGAFFVESQYFQTPRPKERPYPVYWLFGDGRIEKIADVPWGPWRSAGSLSLTPTRAGLVMASSNFNLRSATDFADAGLYLSSDRGVERLVKGWISGLAVAVSPDGCKIAFLYAPVVTQKRNTLQAMDLCKGR